MNRRVALARCLGALLAVGLPSLPLNTHAQPAAVSQRRTALVIGNGDYHFGPLKNPVNDAREMADALRAPRFDVDYRENAARNTMRESIRAFVLRAKSYDVRLFYYAGHGVQLDGKNYLIPTDAEIETADDIPAKSADLNEMLERLGQSSSGMNIVILDACRNNPFADGASIVQDGRRQIGRASCRTR